MTTNQKPQRIVKKAAPDEATAAVYDAAWGRRGPVRATPGRPGRGCIRRSASTRPRPRASASRGPHTRPSSREPDRDPIAILNAQEADRLQELVPLRHARMAESAFAYYRGTPAVMAFDLANAPVTDIQVQICGDAHLSNFGLFASPERALVFDANDFDETLPGPWEWDVKRLAASMVIAGRANGFSAGQNRAAAMAAVRGYRQWMGRFAGMRLIGRLVLHDHGRRHPRDGRGDRACCRAATPRSAAGAQAIESVFSKARGGTA